MPIYLQYYFWLLLTGLFCFALERWRPWRTEQKTLRDQWQQDVFWLLFNGQALALIMGTFTGQLIQNLNTGLSHFGLPAPESLALIANWHWATQFLLAFVLKDFLEWNVHRMLHRIPWLWEFHKLHHSIRDLDWIGNFRFHWFEIMVYKSLLYVPLVVLGADETVMLSVAVVNTIIQSLNHANLPWDYGPLRYVVNSPRMHVWHHDRINHGHGGQNFGIVLSVWDWLFGSAYWPEDQEQPDVLGFKHDEKYPRAWWRRMLWPFYKQ